jgi:uncharacterized protein (TIGR03435 family)
MSIRHKLTPLIVHASAHLSVILLSLHPVNAQIAREPSPPAIKTSTPSYDVMVVKPNHSGSGSVDINVNGDRFSAVNVSLKQILEEVYDIKQDLISGLPGTVESARFDIDAKIADPDPAVLRGMTQQQQRVMLLPLLANRFQLKVHTETKILPVYNLVVLPSGPKFMPSATQTDQGGGGIGIGNNGTRVELTAHDLPMTSLAKSLADQVHRTVVDKTGLVGNFDLQMQWSKDDNPDSGEEVLPNIFTAVQEQLGLKLEPSRGPVVTLVVDHVEMPSEN